MGAPWAAALAQLTQKKKKKKKQQREPPFKAPQMDAPVQYTVLAEIPATNPVDITMGEARSHFGAKSVVISHQLLLASPAQRNWS